MYLADRGNAMICQVAWRCAWLLEQELFLFLVLRRHPCSHSQSSLPYFVYLQENNEDFENNTEEVDLIHYKIFGFSTRGAAVLSYAYLNLEYSWIANGACGSRNRILVFILSRGLTLIEQHPRRDSAALRLWLRQRMTPLSALPRYLFVIKTQGRDILCH
jgi:hypothetical protein